MGKELEDNIRYEQIESLGRILAGFSHDMKNHLGIIRESNGLMEDFIAMGALESNPEMAQRFEKTIATIEKRVIESAEMLKNLSSFAHRSDTPLSTFDLNDLLEEALKFLARFARLKQVDLSFEPEDGLPALHNDPSLLHHIIYRLFMISLDLFEPGNRMTISTQHQQPDFQIVFRLSTTVTAKTDQLFSERLQASFQKLNGTLTLEPISDGQSDITLTLPSKL